MITKGLKVGDTFTDGGNTYKVLKVIGENYESQLVATKPSGFFGEQKQEDFNSLPYSQLKKLCAERGLDATGKKEDLIARLEG